MNENFKIIELLLYLYVGTITNVFLQQNIILEEHS